VIFSRINKTIGLVLTLKTKKRRKCWRERTIWYSRT